MKKLLFLFCLPAVLFLSCNKKNRTYTRVGFYVEDKTASGDVAYDLYIDERYEGKVQVLSAPPADTAFLLFKVLDDSRHEITVRNGNLYLNASYLEITKHKTSSGSSKCNGQKVSGINGWKYVKDADKSYGVFAATR
ncbi:MAG: hypothetical protein IT257_09905 [Chitinophagaceae bacterium]|nr:hypothetical protein [Chitinophagaceae bacterium]